MGKVQPQVKICTHSDLYLSNACIVLMVARLCSKSLTKMKLFNCQTPLGRRTINHLYFVDTEMHEQKQKQKRHTKASAL